MLSHIFLVHFINHISSTVLTSSPEPASVRGESEDSWGPERGHAAELNVLEGLGEDLRLRVDVVRPRGVLPEEGVGDPLGPPLELIQPDGGPPDVVPGSCWGDWNRSHKRETLGEAVPEVVSVLVPDEREVLAQEGHLEAARASRRED